MSLKAKHPHASHGIMLMTSLSMFVLIENNVVAGTGIVTESVNQFDGCNAPNLVNRIANAKGFYDRMLSRTGFTSGSQWTDSNVWVEDFVEPFDQFAVDHSNNSFAIGFVSTHGIRDYWNLQFCTSSADCVNPNAGGNTGESLPSVCLHNGSLGATRYGYCMYNSRRGIVSGESCGC